MFSLFSKLGRRRSLFFSFQLNKRIASDIPGTCTVLDHWKASWEVVTPPAVSGEDAPTALSWLRRRGPALPVALLHKWFREEQLRLYDPCTSKVSRAKKSKQMPAGSLLLVPRSLLASVNNLPVALARADALPTDQTSGWGSRHGKPQLRELSPEEEETRMQFERALRRRVLYHDAELIAVDKPAGLAVQGGSGVSFSVDDLMPAAFRKLVSDGSQLRLVHRLDLTTSGVLLIAKNPDAAAWLSKAFRSASTAATGASWGTEPGVRSRQAGGSAGQGRGLELRKTYWAVVVKQQPRRDGRPGLEGLDEAIPDKGSIDLAVVPGDGGGVHRDGRPNPAALPAQTKFTLRRQSEELAWLELRPQTGRKHQLRIHCAQGLGVPILGDTKYGPVRQPPQRAILKELQELEGGWPQGDRPPMFLHCRSFLLKRPGREAVRIVAPPPLHWHALFRLQRWRNLETAAQRHQVAKKRQSSTKR